MELERVHFYVPDARALQGWLVETWQFAPLPPPADGRLDCDAETVAVGSGSVRFVLSSPRGSGGPVADFLRSRAPGVADLSFRVRDLDAALARATAVGAEATRPPARSAATGRRSATLAAWGALEHTLLEGPPADPAAPIGWVRSVDHAVLNLPAGQLDRALAWYRDGLGFVPQQQFDIRTARSGLRSRVMVHPASGAQLPLNEPAAAAGDGRGAATSQVQEFLDWNGGAGVQHLALETAAIAPAVGQLRARGVRFLAVPDAYYDLLARRQPAPDLDWPAIAARGILADWSPDRPDAPLLQLFTEPIFAAPTFFFELIQRDWRGQRAGGFGERNFQMLFEAVERQQLARSGRLPPPVPRPEGDRLSPTAPR